MLLWTETVMVVLRLILLFISFYFCAELRFSTLLYY